MQRGLVLAELRGDEREGRAGMQFGDHRFGKTLRIGAVRGIVDRNEDLAQPVFGLADLLRLQLLLFRHIGVGDIDPVRDDFPQHLRPGKLGADLIDQGARADAVRCQFRPQRTGLHVVAGFDFLDRGGDLGILDDDLAPLSFLHAKTFIDQLTQNLLPKPVDHLLRHRQTSGNGEQARPVGDVGLADDVAVDDGSDAAAAGQRFLGR